MGVTIQYGKFDRDRFVPETHSSARGDFQRDRGRIIHSSGFRRLSQKTQVLSPTSGVDFARNRLTHSLEVAQVGREIGGRLGVDPDVVDAACLAHDLGHPPFGHNGETAIDLWAADIGGFEGNAQTFRALTKLEPKVSDSHSLARGLNLTRASVDAASKYPWRRNEAPVTEAGRVKFGVYDDDGEVFRWLRDGLPDNAVCLEAQVMDLADDIAYSVHDFEDAIVGGFIDPHALGDTWNGGRLGEVDGSWVGLLPGQADIDAAFHRLRRADSWPVGFSGRREDFARLKNLTSSLIGRFASSVVIDPIDHTQGLPERYRYRLVVPDDTVVEIAVLKALVAGAVMRQETRQPLYHRQRAVLTELLTWLWSEPEQLLEPLFVADFEHAKTDSARRRVIVDQVASLTDASALAWHERLGSSHWG